MANADVIGGPAPREALLARTLVELAETLVADFDVVELLTRLADRCVEVLGVGAAGLMLAGPDGQLKVMASSSEAMRVLELFELQAKEGPCLDCYHSGKPVMQADLATPTTRWPRFAAETLAAGFRSVQALPMRLRGTVIGALNLFHAEAGEMPPADIEGAQALADVATIAIPRAPRLARSPGRKPTAPARPQQPHRHRASQGHGRRESRPQYGAGVHRLAHLCTRPQPAAR
jgi:GAF domain-containing protein